MDKPGLLDSLFEWIASWLPKELIIKCIWQAFGEMNTLYFPPDEVSVERLVCEYREPLPGHVNCRCWLTTNPIEPPKEGG